MNQVAAFDLDGTLVNSALHLLPAYEKSLKETGLPPRPESVMLQCIGGTLEDNRKIVMPEEPMETFLKYEECVTKNARAFAKTHGQAYPGVLESLKELKSHGYQTVLCSNGLAAYVDGLLDTLGLREGLTHVQRIKTEKNKTELLASIIRDLDCAGHIVMVGDRHFDADAARNNHVPFIGCLYGLFPEEIRAANPDAAVESPAELLEAVQKVLGHH